MKDENYPWTLRNQKKTLRMGNPGASIVIYMDIWQKITESQRKRKTIRNVINVNK